MCGKAIHFEAVARGEFFFAKQSGGNRAVTTLRYCCTDKNIIIYMYLHKIFVST